MKRPVAPLPDIEEDTVFTARLQPLASKIIPGIPDKQISRESYAHNADIPHDLNSGLSGQSETKNIQISGKSNMRISDTPDIRNLKTPRQSAAARRDEIEAKRGPKKRFEYVLPIRVGDALAEDARRNGVSATIRLLQVLRDAGYPVIPEDLLDLRVERGEK